MELFQPENAILVRSLGGAISGQHDTRNVLKRPQVDAFLTSLSLRESASAFATFLALMPCTMRSAYTLPIEHDSDPTLTPPLIEEPSLPFDILALIVDCVAEEYCLSDYPNSTHAPYHVTARLKALALTHRFLTMQAQRGLSRCLHVPVLHLTGGDLVESTLFSAGTRELTLDFEFKCNQTLALEGRENGLRRGGTPPSHGRATVQEIRGALFQRLTGLRELRIQSGSTFFIRCFLEDLQTNITSNTLEHLVLDGTGSGRPCSMNFDVEINNLRYAAVAFPGLKRLTLRGILFSNLLSYFFQEDVRLFHPMTLEELSLVDVTMRSALPSSMTCLPRMIGENTLRKLSIDLTASYDSIFDSYTHQVLRLLANGGLASLEILRLRIGPHARPLSDETIGNIDGLFRTCSRLKCLQIWLGDKDAVSGDRGSLITPPTAESMETTYLWARFFFMSLLRAARANCRSLEYLSFALFYPVSGPGAALLDGLRMRKGLEEDIIRGLQLLNDGAQSYSDVIFRRIRIDVAHREEDQYDFPRLASACASQKCEFEVREDVKKTCIFI